MNMFSNQSYACKQGTSYRTTFKNIRNMANGIIKELYPNLNFEERIILAQQEPFWSACRENRQLKEKEIKNLREQK